MRSKPTNYYRPKNWPIFLAAGLLWLLSRLPYRMMLGIGSTLGKFAANFGAKNQRIIMRNLELCFPNLSLAERQALSIKVWQAHGMAGVETAMAWWGSSQKIMPLLTVQGIEHIQTAQASGSGVMLLGAHLTSLELQGRYLTELFPYSCTAKHTHNPIVDYIMHRARLAHYKTVCYPEDLRQTVKRLQKGEIISFLLDQDYGAHGSVFAPFFNIPTATTTTFARIAQNSKSLVMPTFLFRNKDMHGYTLIIYPPLENYPSEDPVADAARFNRLIEQIVMKHPEQYGWTYRRFATRPEGAPPLYD